MVTPQINYFGAEVVHHFQDGFEERGVLFFPSTVFFELPAVNDVAVQDELLAFVLFQKIGYFSRPRTLGAEVEVRDDDCSEMGVAFH